MLDLNADPLNRSQLQLARGELLRAAITHSSLKYVEVRLSRPQDPRKSVLFRGQMGGHGHIGSFLRQIARAVVRGAVICSKRHFRLAAEPPHSPSAVPSDSAGAPGRFQWHQADLVEPAGDIEVVSMLVGPKSARLSCDFFFQLANWFFRNEAEGASDDCGHAILSTILANRMEQPADYPGLAVHQARPEIIRGHRLALTETSARLPCYGSIPTIQNWPKFLLATAVLSPIYPYPLGVLKRWSAVLAEAHSLDVKVTHLQQNVFLASAIFLDSVLAGQRPSTRVTHRATLTPPSSGRPDVVLSGDAVLVGGATALRFAGENESRAFGRVWDSKPNAVSIDALVGDAAASDIVKQINRKLRKADLGCLRVKPSRGKGYYIDYSEASRVS